MPNYNAFGLVDHQEMLDFAQNLTPQRNWMGSTLFPDRKVQYINAEFSRLMRNGTLPQVAKVHGFDTEAVIADRLTWEKVEMEQLLIKEKINQTESLRQLHRQLTMDEIKNYVFDDAGRLFDGVIARVEKAKIDALALGKYVIAENNINMEIDYQIPEENFVKTFWDEDANIVDDLIKWTDQAQENGVTPNTAITTRKVLRKIQRNKLVQKAIRGTLSEGIMPTLAEINALFNDQAGITIQINEDFYGETSVNDGKLVMNRKRFFPEDTFVMVSANANGSIGQGLWGVTPEEEIEGGAFDSRSERQFVTITQWAAQDPTAVWTKASGLFVPVLPEVYGHIIANIADEGSKVSLAAAPTKVNTKDEAVG